MFVVNYAGPKFRHYMSLVGDAVNSPIVATPKKMVTSCTSSDVRESNEVNGRSTRRRCSSAPNIHSRLGLVENSEPDTRDSCSDVADQEVAADPVQPKRRRKMWRRTK